MIRPSRQRAAHRDLPWIVLGVSLLISALAWQRSSDTVRIQGDLLLRRDAQMARDAIVARLDGYDSVLRATAALALRPPDPLDPRTWARVAAALDLSTRARGVQALSIAAWVPAPDLPVHEAAMRAHDLPAYHVRPLDAQADHAPIVFLSPTIGNESALGYDLASEPRRREALDRARDTGGATMTAPIRLVQDPHAPARPAVLLVRPIYAETLPTPATVADRREHLRGFATAAVHVDDLLAGIWPNRPSTLAVAIHDGPEAMHLSEDGETSAASTRVSTTLTVGGRTWVLGLSSPLATVTGPMQPLHVLFGTLIMSGLLFGLVRSRVHSESRALDRATAMTSEVREREQAQRDAAEALRASEARYRRIVETTADGIWIVDARGRITFANARMANLLGLDLSQLIGRPAVDFLFDRERAVVAEGFTRFRATQVDRRDFRLRRADGTALWARISSQPLRDEAGRYEGALAMATDISAERASDEAFRRTQVLVTSIVEHSPNVVFVKEATTLRYVLLNRAAETLLGLPRDEMLGKTDHEVFPAPIADAFTAKDREALAARALVETPRELVETRTQGRRLLRTLKVPILDGDGHPRYLLGISEDVTERVQLDEHLRQAQKMEALGTLASGIAHDINNILASMIAFAELARLDAGSTPRVDEHLTHVLDGGRRAKAVVERIMAFGRRDTSQQRPIVPTAPIEEALRLVRTGLPASIVITQNLTADLPSVLADPGEIEQLVVNLATNAAQALPDRRGQITVTLSLVDLSAATTAGRHGLEPGPHVQLVIRDDGVGMDDLTRQRMFEPFFTTKPPGEGTGLGLAVVHSIVRSHGWALDVDSTLGNGTTVTLWMPAHHGPMAAEATNPGSPPRGDGERVLLIDDEIAVTSSGERLLTHLGYRVTAMTDPSRALAAVRNDPNGFDLIVADVTMPVLGGIELAAEVRRLRPDLPILLATGVLDPAHDEAIRALDIRGILGKPATLAALAHAVAAALHPPAA